MSASIDLLFQNLSTVQNLQQLNSVQTLASASDMGGSIQGFLTFITGTTAIATISPIVSGVHMIALVFTNANPGGVTTGGNIANAVDPAQYVIVFLIYDPISGQWYAQ